jgi:hypothetical protein
MKKRFINCVFLFVFLWAIPTILSAKNPPVAHYPFSSDSIYKDYGSAPVLGSPLAVTPTTGILGNTGAVLLSSSSWSRINCGTSNRGVTNQVTVSAWVKTTGTAVKTIVSKYDYTVDKGYFVFINAAGKAVIDGRDGSGTYRSSGPSTTSVNNDQWHHVVGIVNNDTWEIWVDGFLESSFNSGFTSTSLTNNEVMGIGYLSVNLSYFFTGSIDEVAVYNYALSGNEIGVLRLTNKQVAFFPFAGNAQDRTDNKMNGAISGATLATGHNSVANTAYSFDGNDKIACGTSNRGITNKVTISAWIKTTSSAATTQVVVGKYDYNNDKGYVLLVSSGKVKIDGRDGSGVYRSSGASNTFINDGKWYHVAGVVNIDKWEIWVDGVKESHSTTGYSSTDLTTSLNLSIGNAAVNNSWYFPGTIDDVRVYNEGLSITEIQNLANFNVEALRVGSFDSPFETSTDIESSQAEIYPNPTEDRIEIRQTKEYSKMQLFDGYGVLVSEKNNSSYLSLEHLPAGMYTLQLKDAQGGLLSTHKIIRK